MTTIHPQYCARTQRLTRSFRYRTQLPMPPLSFSSGMSSSATAEVLVGAATASNTPAAPTMIERGNHLQVEIHHLLDFSKIGIHVHASFLITNSSCYGLLNGVLGPIGRRCYASERQLITTMKPSRAQLYTSNMIMASAYSSFEPPYSS